LLGERLRELREQGVIGFNVTIPHKQAVYALCKVLSPQADAAQSVNSVRFLEDGSMQGDNFDVAGFSEALDVLYKDRPKTTACVLGAGGAAKAAVYVLTEAGFERVYVIARNAEKARDEFRVLQDRTSTSQIKVVDPTDYATISNARLIVNTSPIGQTIPRVPDWLARMLARSSKIKPFVFDMVYSGSAEPTLLVAKARSYSLESADGAEMLIRQAAHSFEFWTGKMPPLDLLRSSFADKIVRG
jgi:shikimate dehydrogenase